MFSILDQIKRDYRFALSSCLYYRMNIFLIILCDCSILVRFVLYVSTIIYFVTCILFLEGKKEHRPTFITFVLRRIVNNNIANTRFRQTEQYLSF